MSNAVISAAATGLPSRRLALATLAGAGAALALPKVAKAATVEPDPVFAAIEYRQEAYEAFTAALKTDDGTGPEVEVTSEAHEDALYALASVEPTTLPGLRAMIDHFAQHLAGGGTYDVELAFPSIAASALALLPIAGDVA